VPAHSTQTSGVVETSQVRDCGRFGKSCKNLGKLQAKARLFKEGVGKASSLVFGKKKLSLNIHSLRSGEKASLRYRLPVVAITTTSRLCDKSLRGGN